MGNPNLQVTLDFILGDNTPVFVDKCVTQTHGGSHLRRFKKEETANPTAFQDYFPSVNKRLQLWKEMFEREDVYTVKGVVTELINENTLLKYLGQDMKYCVDFRSESSMVPKRVSRAEEQALDEFFALKQLQKEGLDRTREKKYSPGRRRHKKLYKNICDESVLLWKDSPLYRPTKSRKDQYTDQQLVGATLFMSGHRKKKSALLTSDFGIREYYDHLLEEQPALWADTVKEPIEVFCFRKPEDAPITADKDVLEMSTYFVDQRIREELPVEEMRTGSKQGLEVFYKRTG